MGKEAMSLNESMKTQVSSVLSRRLGTLGTLPGLFNDDYLALLSGAIAR